MKRFVLLGIIVLMTTFMSACGSYSDSQEDFITSVIIEKDGSVKNIIYEDFSKEYYSVEALTDMINNTISDFCRQKPDVSISTEECDIISDSKIVKTVISYDSAQTYSDFNNEVLFFGTVKEAYDAGYDLNRTFKSSVDSDKCPDISKNDVLSMSEKHIIIAEEDIRIKCYSKILYVSDGVNVVNSKVVDVNNDNKYGMIILNK